MFSMKQLPNTYLNYLQSYHESHKIISKHLKVTNSIQPPLIKPLVFKGRPNKTSERGDSANFYEKSVQDIGRGCIFLPPLLALGLNIFYSEEKDWAWHTTKSYLSVLNIGWSTCQISGNAVDSYWH